MLSLAHRGAVEAAATGDETLRRQAVLVAARALRHPDAPAFFGGLQLALAEFEESPFGNDPEDDMSEFDDAVDEDSPSAAPAYEGVTDDGPDDMDVEDDQSESKDGEDEDEDEQRTATSGVVTRRRPSDPAAAAAANLARLTGRG